jgi:adenylate kinase
MTNLVYSRIVLLGPPGCGKGTQAQILSEFTGLKHIASGSLFRDHLGRGTELGTKASKFMEKGLLVPDRITIKMVTEAVLHPSSLSGFMLDGFPRNLAQAKSLDDLLQDKNAAADLALLIVVPETHLIQRMLSRGRPDDTIDTIKTRLKIFRRETEPLIDYYRDKIPFEEIDGLGDIDEIQLRIRGVLTSSL